jgi:DNA-binding response OmpR family regulator
MGRRVVVVDDDRDIREALKDALVERGYQVTVAQNGLKLVAALEVDKPDLIVLDVMMSWIDGLALCRAMKRNESYAGIPVLFVSGRGSPTDIQQGLACGAAGYLVKPFSLSTFLERVEQIIGPAEGARPQRVSESPAPQA